MISIFAFRWSSIENGNRFVRKWANGTWIQEWKITKDTGPHSAIQWKQLLHTYIFFFTNTRAQTTAMSELEMRFKFRNRNNNKIQREDLRRKVVVEMKLIRNGEAISLKKEIDIVPFDSRIKHRALWVITTNWTSWNESILNIEYCICNH